MFQAVALPCPAGAKAAPSLLSATRGMRERSLAGERKWELLKLAIPLLIFPRCGSIPTLAARLFRTWCLAAALLSNWELAAPLAAAELVLGTSICGIPIGTLTAP